jgi:hypothetical protein
MHRRDGLGAIRVAGVEQAVEVVRDHGGGT